LHSSYLGGSQRELGNWIAIDADGNAYVTGATQSSDFPTTLGAFQPAFSGGDPNSSDPNTLGRDAFVAKIVDVALPPPVQP
jgi:hypothetical protein